MEQNSTWIQSMLGWGEMISPPYLLAYVGLAWLIYLWRRETGGFLRWLLPPEIIRHRSSGADLWLFAIGRVMAVTGLVARFGLAPIVAGWVVSVMPAGTGLWPTAGPLALAFMVWIVIDFSTYWTHRLYHDNSAIWPLHAVHHSAEVLTPLTTYRQHPVATIFSAAMGSAIAGVVLGLMVGVITPQMEMAEIVGVNAFIVVANLTVANFHHSHIWVSFGPVLERIIISPAQHHIHHSTRPEHFNRNYGQMLAVWDWMFGTLYITKEREDLTYGLSGPTEAPLMTQRLGPILLDPLRRVFRLAR